jgi:tRNA (adenine-N(1)-)-methyltransferase non-catalytic subunit
MEDFVKEGDTVIIRLQDDKSTCMLKIEGDQKIGKTRVSVKNVIGAPYGSVFQISDRKLEYLARESSHDDGASFDLAVDNDSRGDNRDYVDSNTAQKLSTSDIEKLKESGVSGEDIIKSLIANSNTWSCKTSFAQEKWLKKKKKKYMRMIRVIKSTPHTLCEVYHGKSKDKICNMRPDTLAQILSQSSIHAGSRVLIFESLVGLMVGAVAYRMRGVGKILASYNGQQPHFELVNALNLDDSSTSIIQPLPSTELAAASEHVRNFGFVSKETASVDSCRDAEGVCTKPVRAHHSSGRQPAELTRTRRALREGVDSLIIASKYHPLPVLKEAVHLLCPAGHIAVFCEFMEPLTECYLFLQSYSLAIRLQLSDTWMREFQVLPGRVHPQMTMPVSGGFLLTGIFVGNTAVPKGVSERKRPAAEIDSECVVQEGHLDHANKRHISESSEDKVSV